MIAVIEPVEPPAEMASPGSDGAEFQGLHAGLGQPIDDMVGRMEGSDRIIDHRHLHAAASRGQQAIHDAAPADPDIVEDVEFQVEMVARMVDRIQHGADGFGAAAQEGGFIARHDRAIGDRPVPRLMAMQAGVGGDPGVVVHVGPGGCERG